MPLGWIELGAAMRWTALALLAAVIVLGPTARAAEPMPLQLETKIPLGPVKGRIDHFAVDPVHQRLFVAELGNDTVGVINIKENKLLGNIAGLREPQGVGYVSSTDTVYVANAGDGAVNLFRGGDFAPAGRIELGEDADDIRVDAQANKVYVGYGGGALAVIDPVSRLKVADIPLMAHPEGFQLDFASGRIFVNVPEANQIAVTNRAAGKQTVTWPLRDAKANFPMALDRDADRVLVVF